MTNSRKKVPSQTLRGHSPKNLKKIKPQQLEKKSNMFLENVNRLRSLFFDSDQKFGKPWRKRICVDRVFLLTYSELGE